MKKEQLEKTGWVLVTILNGKELWYRNKRLAIYEPEDDEIEHVYRLEDKLEVLNEKRNLSSVQESIH